MRTETSGICDINSDTPHSHGHLGSEYRGLAVVWAPEFGSSGQNISNPPSATGE